jgi:hypothetical protein
MIAVVASLAAAPACAPDESDAGDLPLTAITGTAASPRGLIVGGVSTDTELFWDAWLVPADGGAPRRLAPIGNNLVAVDADGALWTAITDFGPSGTPSYETRLSPWDGSPSRLLSAELPPELSVERAVADGAGGWLLAGTEDVGGTARGAPFAVDAGGRARRLASAIGEAPLFLEAQLAGDVLQLTLQYDPEGPASIATIPLR